MRSCSIARAPSRVTGLKLQGASPPSSPGVKLRGSKGWSGWRTTTSRARRGSLDRVEELADRHGGRARRVGADVVAGVGDDQAVARRHQRVEQHLAVLGARVAVADVRVGEHDVVAVARGLARERLVVEAEQADDPVGYRAHRHERADGQVAGAEVRARGAALEPLGEQSADLEQRELDRRVGGFADDVAEDPLQLRALPGVALGGGGEGVGSGGELLHPLGDRLGGGEGVDRGLQPVDELGHAARRGRWRGSRRRRPGGRPRTGGGPPRSSSRRRARGRGRLATCRRGDPPACTARDGRRRGPSGCRCRRPSRGCARGPRPRAGSGGGRARGRRGRGRPRR